MIHAQTSQKKAAWGWTASRKFGREWRFRKRNDMKEQESPIRNAGQYHSGDEVLEGGNW